jgi:hypothetical protein
MKTIRGAKFVGVILALVLVMAACGGQSAEEELLEQIFENAGEDIGNIDINTDGDDFTINIEGEDEDGENFSITGGGDDGDFEFTIEGEDGETLTFGGGTIPDNLQIPIPDGGDVQSSIEGDGTVIITLIYPGSEFGNIVAFYDSQLNPDSDEVDRFETSFTSDEGQFDTVGWNATDGGWNVNLSTCSVDTDGNLDQACLTIFQMDS